MRIAEAHTYRIHLPILDGPYTMSGREVYEIESTIVELVTEDGAKGYGEVCPMGAAYQAEHSGGAQAAIAELAPCLIGGNPLQIDIMHHRMDAALFGHNYAKAAVDIALWDLCGKHYAVRVCDLLGGAHGERVPSYFALGMATPGEPARYAIEKVKEGFKRLQIKAGDRDIHEDIASVRKVWEAVGTNAKLVVDANRGWTARDAIYFSKACAAIPLTIEQPCGTISEVAGIRAQLDHPIFLDELTVDLDAVLGAVGCGLCDGFGFKPTRLGGLTPLRTARDICAARNLPHTCDDVGGDILAAACVHIGATVDPARLEGVWIAQPYIGRHYDPENGIAIVNGQFSLPKGPGLGITPDPAALGAPVASWSKAADGGRRGAI